MKNWKANWKINLLLALLILLVLGGLIGAINANNSELTEEEFIAKLLKENEDNPESAKYLVTDEFNARVAPQTKIKDFKESFSNGEIVKVYEDEACTKEVKSGYILSGMYAKYVNNDRCFKLSVFGDINSEDKGKNNVEGDGLLNQVELTRNIRHYVKTSGWEIKDEEEKQSADVTCNRLIDDEDAKSIIRYIVYDELEIPAVKKVESPKIEVVEGKTGSDGKYVGTVKIKITEQNKKEETKKTIYKITGTKEQEYTQIEASEEEIELSGEGIYKITSYTYGKLGNKSKGSYELIKIGNGIKEYKVEHYKETLEDGKYVLAETENLAGLIDQEVTATSKKYVGFTFDENNTKNVKTGVITLEDDLTLKLYYKRNSYKLTLDKDEYVDTVTGEGTYKYEQMVPIDAILKKEVEEGYKYDWQKWASNNKELLQDQLNKKTDVKMPAGNITLTATALKNIKSYDYFVNYYFDGEKNDELSYKDVAKYGSIIDPEIGEYPEYELDKKENCPMTIGAKDNTINIYFKIVNYNIKYDLDGGKLNEGSKNPEEYNTKTPTFTLINPIKKGYIFTGWTGSNGKTPQDVVTISIGSKGDKEYKANWKANTDTKYTVIHYTENLDGTWKEQQREVLGGETEKEVTAKEKSYPGFTYNEEKSTPIGVIKADGSLVLKMYYTRNKYKLTLIAGSNILNVKMDGENAQAKIEKTLKYQEKINISATLKEQEGYTVEWKNWTSNDEKILVNQAQKEALIGMPLGDVTLTATATKTVNKYNYTVEYYYDDVIDNDKTETKLANFGTTISSYTKKEIDGYELDKVEGLNLKIGTDETKNVIKVYYKQTLYTIAYRNIQNTTFTRENPKTYTIKTEDINLCNPEKPGYTFLGWTGTGLTEKTLSVTIAKGSMGNREYTAHFNADDGIKYKVEHYTEKLETGTYELYKEENDLEGIMDDTVTASPIAIAGFTYDVEKSKNTIAGTIKADGSLVLKVYYSRNSYNLTLKTGENIQNVETKGQINEKSVTVSLRYGERASITATLKEEEGYTINFDKWVSENDNLGNQVGPDAEFTMPAGDVILRAEGLKNINSYKYTVEYYYDNIYKDKVEKSANYNQVITQYPEKSDAGYEFDKVEGLDLTISINESQNIIKVYYKSIIYNITYKNIEGATFSNENPATYTVNSDDITLNNPEKPGYTFDGWTGSNGDTKELQVTIPKGSTGDKEYTANWRANTDIRYIVEHYTENLDGLDYTLHSRQGENGELIGTMDTVVTAEPITIHGFTYNEEKSKNTISGTVVADGSLVLKVYYTRNSYTLKVVAGENISTVINSKESSEIEVEKTYKFEESVEIGATLDEIEGYTVNWANWTSSNTNLIPNADIQEANSIVTIPAGNVILTANATKAKKKFDYTVKYYYDGTEDEAEKITNKAEFESQIISYTDKVKDGYEFDKVENLPLTITANSENNVISVYYKLIDYEITYNLDGGILGTDDMGEEIVNPSNYNIKSEDIILNNPTKEGFLFLGWTGGTSDKDAGTTPNLETPTKNVTIKTGSMGDRTYTANWEELIYQVTVHHYLQNTEEKLAEDEVFTSKVLGEEYKVDDLIPTYDEDGDIIETDGRQYIDGKEYYVVSNSGNTEGVYEENPIEVIYYYQHYPVIRIVSSPDATLNGTEYITIEDALKALKDAGLDVNSETSKLQVLRDVKDEAVLVQNQNVEINLDGFTINSSSKTEPTIKLDNSKATIIDESELKTGKIVSENGIGVYIKANSEFNLGIEDKPVELSPEIIANTKGVEKEISQDGSQGIFNFFDGKITATKAIEGTVDLTPLLYNATVAVNEDGKQVSTLAVISDVEARIGRKTYTLLEDAINDANTVVGEDGSQVEITIIKDITKSQRVIVDSGKNIKLDLAGYTLTSSAQDYVLENRGDLEIVDSSSTPANPYGTGKITSTTYSTILNSYTVSDEVAKYTSSDLQSDSTYSFIEKDGKLVSNNNGINNTVADSYVKIDLSGKTGEYILNVNAEISSETNDYGYATITNSTSVPSYTNLNGRFIYISGEQVAKDYITVLKGGNVYYLHICYLKNGSTNLLDDEFKINSITLNNKGLANLTLRSGTYKIETSGSGSNYKKVIENNGNLYLEKNNSENGNILHNTSVYNFDIVDGVLKNNNTNIYNTFAGSYVEIDLTNNPGTHTVTVNAEISSKKDNHFGYATIKETNAVPEYKDENGRFIYLSGAVAATDYSMELEGGKKYYLHLGYYKNTSSVSGTDEFTINSIKLDGEGIKIEKEVSPYLYSSKNYTNLVKGEGNVYLNSGRLLSEVSGSVRGIEVDGNVEMNGGSIKILDYPIRMLTTVKPGSTVTINGGTICSSNMAIYNNSGEKVIINNLYNIGGNIYNESTLDGEIIINNGIYNGTIYNRIGKIEINDGTFNNVVRCENTNRTSDIDINGGTFYGEVTNYSNISTININNGTFNKTITNSSDGNMNIYNGNINVETGMAVYNRYRGILSIYGGNIISSDNTVYNNNEKGTVNVYGGTITSTGVDKCSIYNNLQGTINIGNKEEVEIKSSPEIIATSGFGIKNINGTLNYYDGILKGKENQSIYGQVSEIPENSQINISYEGENNEVEVSTLAIPERPVAQISGTTYTTLQSAIDACQDNTVETIQVIDNIYVSNTNIIPENKDIILDLNSFRIKSLTDDAAIENNGNLQIVDNASFEETVDLSSKVDYGTYGFNLQDNKLISTNNNVNKSSSLTYIPIDLRNYSGVKKIIVNSQISSEGADHGWAIVTQSQDTPSFVNNNSGKIVNISGVQEAKDYEISLIGGKMYYLHLAYMKDVSVSSGDDTFTVNSISIKNGTGKIVSNGGSIVTNNSNLNLGNIGVEIQTEGKSNAYKTGIVNKGTMQINGADIEAGTSTYTNIIVNDVSGTIEMNSGNIVGTGNAVKGIYNISTGDVIVNDGTINSRIGIYNENTGTVTINSGNIKGYSDSAITNIKGKVIIENGNISADNAYGIKTSGGTVTINNGKFEANNNNIICVNGASEVTINNAVAESMGGIATVQDKNGKVTIKDGTYNCNSTIIQNSGTVDLQGGTFTTKGQAIVNQVNSTMTISNAIINCVSFNGIDNRGTLNFISGTFNNTFNSDTARGIYTDSYGTLTLGSNDETVSQENPSISIQKGYGIYNNNGTFNFYDGIIKASPNKTIYGTVSDQADGYEIIKTINAENTQETAILDVLPIAKVVSTGIEYNTIQEAVDACQDNTLETIQILRDALIVATVPEVTIPEGKNIVLDINGYELSAGNKDTFVNNGNLEVIDSSEGQVGLLKNTSYSLFRNEGNGNLTFTSGNIATTAVTYTGEDNIKYNCYLAVNNGTGTITVNGANITSMYGILNTSTGEVKILQGTLNANDNNGIGIQNTSMGKVTIEGGTVSGVFYAIDNVVGEVNLKGGIVTSRTYGIRNIGEGKVYISGGEINNCINYKIYMSGGNLEISDGIIGRGESGLGIYAEKNSQLVITGGTINTYSNGIYIRDAGTSLKMSNGTITSLGEAINVYGGNIEITGGEFTSTSTSSNGSVIQLQTAEDSIASISNCTITSLSQGTSPSGIINRGVMQIGDNTTINVNTEKATVITNTGTLTLGTNDGEVKDSGIMLNGGVVGVDTKGKNNVFNYYDGTITAKEIIKGEVNVPNGYSISSTSQDTKYVAILKPVQDIVQIGDTTYNSLQEAIDACPVDSSQTTIKVIKPYVSTLTNRANIESGKNIIVDLNGYKITNYGGMFNNNGKLEITDSSQAKTGIIEGYANNLIANTGELTLNANITQNRNFKFIDNSEQGNVKIEGQNIVINNDFEYYSNCYGIYNASTGTVEMTGGDISVDTRSGKSAYAIYSAVSEEKSTGNIILTGGNIHGIGDYRAYGIWIARETNANVKISNVNIELSDGIYSDVYSSTKNCNIEITSGTITSKNIGVYLTRGTNAKISGGEIINTSTTNNPEECYAIRVDNGATLEISGGTINSNKVCGIYQTSGDITITSGKIESLNAGIRTSGGTLNILGGEINVTNSDKEQYGIYITNVGTVNLGTKEYPVSKLSPSIKSGKYGVYCNGANTVFNFYDGIIEGKEKAIYGIIKDTPELYKVQLLDGETIAILGVEATFERVCVMDGIYYDSLQTAIDSAGTTPQTIRIEKDNVVSEPVIIKEGQDITIDLYGNSIILPEGSCAIENNGTLILIDTLPEIEGEVIICRVENYSGTAIQNNGTLTLGVDDGVENQKSPLIKGGITGQGTVNKYDGVIE